MKDMSSKNVLQNQTRASQEKDQKNDIKLYKILK